MASLKQIIIALFFLMQSISLLAAHAKKADYLLAFSDSASGRELWGFKTSKGQIIIQPKYEYVSSDTLFDMVFATQHFKWIAIDKKGIQLLYPYIFDNGPDYVADGFFRFTENNKIGFADLKGRKIIAAQFDFANPFSSGLAAICLGGKMEKWDDEHHVWKGGIWGFINKKGQVIIKPQFKTVYGFVDGKCEVITQENKHVLIDKKGSVIKTFAK